MSSNINTDSLDAYNPFAEPRKGRVQSDFPPKGGPGGESNQSSVKNPFEDDGGSAVPTSLPSSSAMPSKNPSISQDAILAIERRQAQLEARAAELDRREKEHEASILARQAQQAGGAAPHNWPPLPPWCPCRPCVRQDFEADIPLDCQWMAKMGYGLWLAYAVVLILNLGGTLGNFIVGTGSVEGPLFGASIIFLLVMPPLSFYTWHRPLYKALKSDNSLNYIIFFGFFALQIIVVLIQCLGIDYAGSCGWINGLKACRVDKSVCTLMLIVAALFSGYGVFGTFLLIKVHRHYRQSGASIRKAKLEMTSSAATYAGSGAFGSMP